MLTRWAEAGSVVHALHPVELADVDVVLPQDHGVRPVDVVPHGDEPARGVEDLDAVGLPVGHVDALVRADDDVVGADELAGVDAGAAPGQLVLALGREDVDCGVAIAVGDVELAGPGHDGGGRWGD